MADVLGRHVAFRAPRHLSDALLLAFNAKLLIGQSAEPSIVVEDRDGKFDLLVDGKRSAHALMQSDLLVFMMDAVVRAAVTDLTAGVALHAGAVIDQGRAILVCGPSGSGKSTVTGWLVDHGLGYLSDELLLLDQCGRIKGYARPLVLKAGSAKTVQRLPCFQDARAQSSLGQTFVNVPPHLRAPETAHSAAIIIFPAFAADADLKIEVLSPGQAALRLVACNLNARNLPDGGVAALAAVSRQTIAVRMTYGDIEQLKERLPDCIDLILRSSLPTARLRSVLDLMDRPQAGQAPQTPRARQQSPAATPPLREPKKLTIGMATYDDYDGVYFTIQALRMYHSDVRDQIEFLVVDNNPTGPCAPHLKELEKSAENFRYVPCAEWSGTAVRQRVFEEASGTYVLCMDSHVLVVPQAIKRLLEYFDRHPTTPDLLQGPLIYDDLKTLATHFKPQWRSGMFGVWDLDPRGLDEDGEPFEIPMQGLGLAACRKDAWLGYNSNFQGFGGEEFYIHEKFRQAGRKTLCLPFLRWMHRFNRPNGIPYVNKWDDRVRNYTIGFRELGLATDEMENHFRELLGQDAADSLIAKIQKGLLPPITSAAERSLRAQ